MTSSSSDGKSDDGRSPHLQAFEAQMSALRPREDRLDRERLMYLAGQASASSNDLPSQGKRPQAVWHASWGAVAGVAATLLVMALAPRDVETLRRGASREPPSIAPREVAVRERPTRKEGVLYASSTPTQLQAWLDADMTDSVEVIEGASMSSQDFPPPLTSRDINDAI